MNPPAPLTAGHLCPVCKGTGADAAKTAAMYRSGGYSGHIRCWNCNGNGLDPAAYFRFSPAAQHNTRSAP